MVRERVQTSQSQKSFKMISSKNPNNTNDGIISKSLKLIRKYINYEFMKSLLFDPAKLPIVSAFILIIELVLNIVVIEKVRYTEIDWKAYMQECEGFINGTTNYALLKGDTGPLVYPAGFVYIYTILYYITSKGQNIRLAQYIFAFIYLIQLYLVLRLYSKSYKVPPYVIILSIFTSYRIHSIYILRLFNDPIAILFFYISLNLFINQKWLLGSIFYSISVSIKMNILLFSPAILLFYIINLGILKTIYQLFICGLIQIILGLPFLLTYPLEYIKGSFNLGRIFEHKWTVNYRFLDPSIFENRLFHLFLLCIHILLLILFTKPSYKYFQNYCRLRELEKQLQPQIDRENQRIHNEMILNKKQKQKQKQENSEKLTKEQETFLNNFEKSLKQQQQHQQLDKNNDDNDTISSSTGSLQKYSINFDKCIQLALLPIFLCNFIGIICARSLHYQFYVWYFHTLPYLCWSTDYSLGLRFLLLGLIEFAWNTYPSTNESSLLLHACHLVLLIGIAKKMFKTHLDSEKFKNMKIK